LIPSIVAGLSELGLDKDESVVYYATMPRAHRYATVNDDLLPTWTTRSHDYDRQVESMREIRELSNGIASAHRERDQRLAALALSNGLSRTDMARAAGLSKARIDQILFEVAEEDRRRKNVEAEERVRRHSRIG
jgi:DNA-directed RNA polymerase specialized sigma subunit